MIRRSIWEIVTDIDTVILDTDMGYGLMIWEMTVSIRSSSVSIWDILSLCLHCPASTPSWAATSSFSDSDDEEEDDESEEDEWLRRREREW
jgi:hypothetical protein